MTRDEAVVALQDAMFGELWEGAAEGKPQPPDYKGVGVVMAERALEWFEDADERTWPLKSTTNLG